ncbi:MAG: type II secretion system F family protein, partial [Planctomycetes bacterium]|nr:type II secretion system F family protein [Planctomycetota bacterium]
TFGIGAVLVMLMYFVPKFDKFFSGSTQPMVTELLFGASRLLRGHWAVLSGLVMISIVGIAALLQSAPGRAAWNRWQLKLPVVGVLLRRVGISRFCRILGTMLHNGVPILEALAIAKDAAGNAVLSDRIATAAESVRGGDSLAEPLRGDGLFPDEILEMIVVAEESNQLEKVLIQIADTIDRRTARELDEAVKLIEPVILVVIAGAVGMMAGGLLYPIFNMAKQLK